MQCVGAVFPHSTTGTTRFVPADILLKYYANNRAIKIYLTLHYWINFSSYNTKYYATTRFF